MRTYFRNKELVITEREVIPLREPGMRFAIANLNQVHTVQGGAGRGWRIYPRPWELRAIYRGTNVCLYSTTDQQTFGQVRRAMIRALEANGKL